MRCLTLAEAFIARGHDVHLMAAEIDVPWIAETLTASSIELHKCRADDLPLDDIVALRPDWVIVDSYTIDPFLISQLNLTLHVLAVIDGDDRDIQAELYLDQNLGAETDSRKHNVRDHVLAGAKYALIRDAVLAERREHPWHMSSSRPSVVAFAGGTDPTDAGPRMAEALVGLGDSVDVTFVAPKIRHLAIAEAFGREAAPRILAPTTELPTLLGAADVVVSAAGTSAWDVCTLGIPSVLIAVVGNQQSSLMQAVSRGLSLGIDATHESTAIRRYLGAMVSQLVSNQEMRKNLSRECLATFDGRGKVRVVEYMELSIQ